MALKLLAGVFQREMHFLGHVLSSAATGNALLSDFLLRQEVLVWWACRRGPAPRSRSQWAREAPDSLRECGELQLECGDISGMLPVTSAVLSAIAFFFSHGDVLRDKLSSVTISEIMICGQNITYNGLLTIGC